jgi:hypothetical protein
MAARTSTILEKLADKAEAIAPLVGLPANVVHAALVKGMISVKPPKRTLRELLARGHTVTGLAEAVGVERSTLREKLDRKDMLISNLEKILNQLGFDLEVRATTPEGAVIVKLGGE